MQLEDRIVEFLMSFRCGWTQVALLHDLHCCLRTWFFCDTHTWCLYAICIQRARMHTLARGVWVYHNILDPYYGSHCYSRLLSILYTVCILDNSSSSSTILACSTMHSMNTIILCIQLFELVRKSSRTMRNKIQHDVSISTMHTAVCVVRNLIVINIPAARRARM